MTDTTTDDGRCIRCGVKADLCATCQAELLVDRAEVDADDMVGHLCFRCAEELQADDGT